MTSLRIALVHSFYGSEAPSGENEAVLAQAAALGRAGHDVHLVAARTDELRERSGYAARCAVTVATGRGRSPVRELRSFAPDVVHVHNLFPNFGRDWTSGWTGPLVTTLHNYRPLCAAATLYRDAGHCTSCLTGDRWAGLRHGCYRGSRTATLPLAWAGRGGVAADPLLRRADRVVVLSELSRDTYARAGLPVGRTALIPNFVSPVDAPAAGPGSAWVYAGRLSPEKGIVDLLRKWPEGERLDVIGSGPMEAACRAEAPASVRFLGALGREELRRGLSAYRGLVFPSRCLEGVPLVYLEALAAGLPVLALEGSTVPVLVRAEGTGHVVGWDTPLADSLRAAGRDFPALRERCREVYGQRYGEEAWVGATVRMYGQASGHGAGSLPSAIPVAAV
ncbi:glycosyltransferase family 4 protein [Streptomyces beijiangensis]|uniref:Glycosyltransferase family 4 protein n=1 Tax=Streptomyces beijiangensis TaxID=163361 RepID=A0A939F4H5_9ACTN|nr:glycosyltransferase family 4 protein [Streptomyces beijiangensis]MBO0511753.1 glycosyltransferase family 4 protein [Streptomyces beijiangensis]